MKYILLNFLITFLLFNTLFSQEINFGYIYQSINNGIPDELQRPNITKQDAPLDNSASYQHYVNYTYYNAKTTPGFFFDIRYKWKENFINLGYKSLGYKNNGGNENEETYRYGSLSGFDYRDEKNSMKISVISISIERDYKFNELLSLAGMSEIPSFLSDMGLHVGLESVNIVAGKSKGEMSGSYRYSSTSTEYYYSDPDNNDKIKNWFKAKSGILIGLSYLVQPKLKIFAEYSSSSIKSEKFSNYSSLFNYDEKAYSGSSGSIKLGLSYDFSLSSEQKSEKLKKQEAKRKAKRDKVKKELENF